MNLVKDFLENGYFRYQKSKDMMALSNQLANAWKFFYLQDLKTKQRYPYNEIRGGYEYKGPEEKDYKENFHITLSYDIPENATYALVNLANVGHTFISRSFDSVRVVFDIMSEATKTDLTLEVCRDINRWQLRLLHYFPRKVMSGSATKLAMSHIDKGITTHWYEDAPGLQIFWNGKWIDVNSDHSFLYGYFGMLGQYYSKCAFPALCHRVMPTPYTLKNGRVSIVMFHDFGDVVYDKLSWGSTQEVFPRGENYPLTFPEFKKYFIPVKKLIGV